LVAVRFATTTPVTTAVTIISAIPIAISFQGLQLFSIWTLLTSDWDLPETTIVSRFVTPVDP